MNTLSHFPSQGNSTVSRLSSTSITAAQIFQARVQGALDLIDHPSSFVLLPSWHALVDAEIHARDIAADVLAVHALQAEADEFVALKRREYEADCAIHSTRARR